MRTPPRPRSVQPAPLVVVAAAVISALLGGAVATAAAVISGLAVARVVWWEWRVGNRRSRIRNIAELAFIAAVVIVAGMTRSALPFIAFLALLLFVDEPGVKPQMKSR